MNASIIDEPVLEFGSGFKHVDIRFGLMFSGPLDIDTIHRPEKINLGVIGSSESIEGACGWLEKCSRGVDGKESRQPNLYPRFPGCNEDVGLRTRIITADSMNVNLTNSQINKITGLNSQKLRVEATVDLLFHELQQLIENNPSIDVVLCATPLPLVNCLDDELEDDDSDEPNTSRLVYDYRDMLKARMMQLRKPIQIIRPSTYDETKARMQKKRPDVPQSSQHEAIRAWNIFTALYYKAGGTPWRIVRSSSDLTTCYVGICFFKAFESEDLRTSIAQVFNERGEGVIVRGGAAAIYKDDRQPHLTQDDIKSLLSKALMRYRDVHRTMPARVVVHKSSEFNIAEIDGCTQALEEERIYQYDLLSFGISHIRLSRTDTYPPLRGTMLSLTDKKHILYTKGSVDFFRTWPGMYTPSPRMMKMAAYESTPRFLAQEILSLTKMNWNNSQFDGADPITIRAAREVSRVLRYCSEDIQPETRYSYYM